MAIIAVLVFAKGDWKKKRLISGPTEEERLTREVGKETMIEEGIA